MVTANDIIQSVERLAPPRYAESWDNVGLMVGSRNTVVTGIVTTLDVTMECIEYALEKGCNMIVSHHPFFFKGIKQIDTNTAQGKMIAALIRCDMVVYSAHTNLDIAPGGLNDMLAQRLGLENIKGFVKTGTDVLYKITTFVPHDAAETVRAAMGNAGAGQIGNYSHCSFSYDGEGRFMGNGESNPAVGTKEQLETVPEVCLNMVANSTVLSKVITALKSAHPYEEVAYEVVALAEPEHAHMLGKIGTLPESLDFDSFRKYVHKSLPHALLRFGGEKKTVIKRIALCSGAGAEFLKNAKRVGVDAYITGDVKYHEAQLARELGILVVDAGHFGTEEIVANGLANYLNGEGDIAKWSIPIIPFEDQFDFFFE